MQFVCSFHSYKATMFRLVNSKKQPGDRFIPQRVEINVELFNDQNSQTILETNIDQKVEFINTAKILYNRHNYQNTLRNVLLPLDTKVLNFFPPKKFSPTEYVINSNQLWPVKPRKKPVIGRPEMILDMPDFDSNTNHHIADWSSQNCLAIILECEVHMEFPNECQRYSKTSERAQHCIKWMQGGRKFAVGLFPHSVGIYDIGINKIIHEKCCCASFCEVFCLEWIGDKYLLAGCSRGILTLYTSDLKVVRKVSTIRKSSVVAIVSNCNKKFVATSTMDKTVAIWTLPNLECHYQIPCKGVVRALAWHPWKSSLLALGHCCSSQSRVTLWNINSLKKIECEENPYKNSTIDALTFNPITGELVVGYFVRTHPNHGSGIITVMSHIDTIVEELHIHRGPILYLLWGSEGKLLASASADETLCIWDFFGKKVKIEMEEKKHVEDYMRKSELFRSLR